MKRLMFVPLLAVVLGFSTLAHATLTVNGVDSNGYQLIYDSALNITWYDYTYTAQGNYETWEQATAWATGLNIDGVAGWRLPTNSLSAYNSYSDQGEMGYLYYDELGNTAGGPFANAGPFKNLKPYPSNPYFPSGTPFWSGTELDPNNGAVFTFGLNVGYYTVFWDTALLAAAAVHNGDVLADGEVLPYGPTATPIPSTFLLLGSGLAGLIGLKRKRIFG